ncbi:GMC family oxidoreductase [Agrobacterium sp. LAD9]|uniref:GMC family oxidoreductase n=1 Tax=Agrobacterium sp. LAD9 TaxID=2055153 RepID=UPI000D1F09F8|nr:GMC family oxidoreductase [Agrobacterium sp. LAD9]
MTTFAYDVAIIGSGFAGTLVASKLAAKGLSVAIIEAGSSFEDSRGVRQKLREAFAKSDEEEVFAPYEQQLPAGEQGWKTKPYSSIRHPQDSQFAGDYLRIVGGTGLAWLGTALRMSPNDFRMRSAFGRGRDWPISYDDIEPWYCLAEEHLGVAGEPDADASLGAYRSRPFPMPPIAQSYSDRYVAGQIGHLSFEGKAVRVVSTPQARNSVEGYNGRSQCEGYASCVPLCPVGAKYDPLIHLRQALLSGADLFENATVTELETAAHGRVTSAIFRMPDGSVEAVQARIFVLAANGIETPKLLLQSNKRYPGGIANESGNVGCHLMDHPQKYSCALLCEPVFPYRGPQSTSGIEVLRDGGFRRNRAAFRTAFRNDGWRIANSAPLGNTGKFLEGTLLDLVGRRHLSGRMLRSALVDMVPRQFALQSVLEVLPIKENRVSLSPGLKDEWGSPRAEINFRIGQYERDGIAAATLLHKAIFDALGCRQDETFLHMQDAPLEPDPAGSHIMGTTVMGLESRDSVVDPNCRAHGHPNLFIVGSSVFPTGSTANPTLTICALALRTAAFIEDIMQTGELNEFADRSSGTGVSLHA